MNRSVGVTMSVILHGAAGIAVLVLVQMSAATAPRPVPRPLTFIPALAMSSVPEVRVTVPSHLDPPAPLVVPREVPALPGEPPPLTSIDARVELVRPLAVEPSPSPPSIEPSKPAPPAVTVGAFSNSSVVALTAEVGRTIQPSGFDAAVDRAIEVRRPATAVGAFDRPAATAPPGAAQPGHAVAGVDFGGGTSASPPATPPRQVRQTDFDSRVAPPASSQRAASPRIEAPVEILSKPTPVYTDEARALKLEGEVVLDVEFAASGEVHVIRLLSGLGHGLDEAATRAAAGMRFKPAQASGRAIDYRTTVHIVFRLA